MSDVKIEGYELKPGFKGMATDTGSDQTMFKGVQWGKVMMWIFLLPALRFQIGERVSNLNLRAPLLTI